MNESTLVPREELERDLDWLARNVHVWRDGANYVCVNHTDGGHVFHEHNRNCAIWFTKAQWLARRAELQNKPSWSKAEEWAGWLAQDSYGCWGFFQKKPLMHALSWIARSGYYQIHSPGNSLLGDWRDTLEKRPEVDPEISYNLNCEVFAPFVSVEDAATAKQPAPKGSGNPILGMVLADLTNRALEGKEKYGEPLLANNGRNPLWDAYQEALDLAMYLRQAIEEQK